MRKHLAIFLVLFSCGTLALAQQTASATMGGSVTITTPTSIYKADDMSMKDIEVPKGKGPSSVVIDPKAKKGKGGKDDPNDTTGSQPAKFTINVPEGYTYNISFPSKPVSEDDSTANLMNITNFNSDPPNTELNTGTQTYSVGATVNLGEAKEDGEYEAEVPFDVTVGYN